MRVQVLMPQWGMGMRDGTIAKWLKQEGDPVTHGEAIVEVEAEKVTATVDAPVSGTLARRAAVEGDVVEVQGLIAEIDEA